ncbi:hypothetical protein ACFQ3S_02665 [Mucilaginibacter terrae]|uniref:hypothetical protein n=1 Tax=Mucilaginibacter terrae TaxID=1955052 RepID=UPI00362F4A3A
MKVNEDLSILCWLKLQKVIKEDLVFIYVRNTVKCGRTDFIPVKIHSYYWDEESPAALSAAQTINSLIATS